MIPGQGDLLDLIPPTWWKPPEWTIEQKIAHDHLVSDHYARDHFPEMYEKILLPHATIEDGIEYVRAAWGGNLPAWAATDEGIRSRYPYDGWTAGHLGLH